MAVKIVGRSISDLFPGWVKRPTTLLIRFAWHSVGPLLVAHGVSAGIEGVGAATGPAYLTLWLAFSEVLIGSSLCVASLSALTLPRHVQHNVHPLHIVPFRLALVAVLWLVSRIEISQVHQIFIGLSVVLVWLLVGPWLAEWIRLVQYTSMHQRKVASERDIGLLMNDRSRRRVCVHEAGHALIYGLGSSIPEDLFAFLDPMILDGRAGAVGFSEEMAIDRTTVEQLRFRLVVIVAGAAAEDAFLGDVSSGCYGDYEDFDDVGELYLRTAGAMWFTNPKNASEAEVNARALAELKKQCFDLAKTILLANKDPHDALCSALDKLGELAYPDLLPILSNVEVDPAWNAPVPVWPEDMPTHALTRSV